MQLVRFARFILLLRVAVLEYSSAGAMVARQTSNLEAVGSSPTRNVMLFFLQNQIQNCPSTIITCFLFVPDLIILYFPRLTFFLSVRPGEDDRRHHRVIQYSRPCRTPEAYWSLMERTQEAAKHQGQNF